MAASSSLRLQLDVSDALAKATRDLLRKDLLVGIPADSKPRPLEPGEKASPPNALIGYVQEFGDEEKGIPPRPFLMPGIEDAKPAIIGELVAAGITAMHGGAPTQIEACFTKAGLAAQAAVKKKIIDGPFAPLSERTLEARARRVTGSGKASQAESSKAARRELASRAAGNLPSADAKPLYDTHSLFNSITFVVRDKRDA